MKRTLMILVLIIASWSIKAEFIQTTFNVSGPSTPACPVGLDCSEIVMFVSWEADSDFSDGYQMGDGDCTTHGVSLIPNIANGDVVSAGAARGQYAYNHDASTVITNLLIPHSITTTAGSMSMYVENLGNFSSFTWMTMMGIRATADFDNSYFHDVHADGRSRGRYTVGGSGSNYVPSNCQGLPPPGPLDANDPWGPFLFVLRWAETNDSPEGSCNGIDDPWDCCNGVGSGSCTNRRHFKVELYSESDGTWVCGHLDSDPFYEAGGRIAGTFNEIFLGQTANSNDDVQIYDNVVLSSNAFFEHDLLWNLSAAPSGSCGTVP